MTSSPHSLKTDAPEREPWTLTGSRAFDLLLIAVPTAIALAESGRGALWVFLFSAAGLVALTAVLGHSTRDLSGQLGPLAAGIIQATFGNATEFIIAIVALRAGLIDVVKASLTGSIIGNLLFVLGFSMLLGGWGREKQLLNRAVATTNATMLFLAAVGLVMPAVYALNVYGHLGADQPSLHHLSLWTAVILIVIYLGSLYFQLHSEPESRRGHILAAPPVKRMAWGRPVLMTIVATVLIALLSKYLVHELDAAKSAFQGTDLFWGAIVFALIGNAAEQGIAIAAARRDEMDLAMAIGVGSSLQIALLLTPVLALISFFGPHPMTLVFSSFEITAVVISVLIVGMIASDGETNWFEGMQLLAVYAIIVAAFYFVPA